MKHQTLTPGALALALTLSAFWGANSVAIKVGLLDSPPLRLGWMRFVLGGAVVLAVALARRQSLRVVRSEWMPLLGLGVLFSVQLALMNVGQDLTSAGHASVIISAFPLWAVLLAHFFVPGDRLTFRRGLGSLVAYAGVVVVIGTSARTEGATLTGDLLLAASSFLLGARQIVLARTAEGIAIEKLLLSQAVLGTASFVLASAVFEPEPTNVTARLAGSLLYQGVLIAGFAFLLQTWLLKNFSPARVSTVYLSQPIFGLVASWLVLGEHIGAGLWLGALLVVVGSYFAQLRD